MSNEELEASLRTYNRRRPFRPYLLEFVSGIQVRIENRESGKTKGSGPFSRP